MTYQLFNGSQQPKNGTSASSSPPQIPYARHDRPPIPPPSPVQPPSVSTASKPPTGTGDTIVQPSPYPYPIPRGYATPHPHITVEPVCTAHLQSLTRITGLLLPIRYPNSFFTTTITDPVFASLSRVAIYHDYAVAALPASASSSTAGTSLASRRINFGTGKVVGGIRCRLERLPQTASELLRNQSHGNTAQEPMNLYIQTLLLLSPYRGNGAAASLLNSLLFATPPGKGDGYQVSRLVKHYNIRTVTAHVHEANEDALNWYTARGFQVHEGVVENYYRRLEPSGARIVQLVLLWDYDEDDDGVVVSNASQEQQPNNAEEDGEQGIYDGDDEEWEKVEAESEDEKRDHDIQPFTDSKILQSDGGGSRKRKADDEPTC